MAGQETKQASLETDDTSDKCQDPKMESVRSRSQLLRSGDGKSGGGRNTCGKEGRRECWARFSTACEVPPRRVERPWPA